MSADVRTWMREHAPHALPWQVELVERFIEARETGKRFHVARSRRGGMTLVREAIQRYVSSSNQPGTDTPRLPELDNPDSGR